MDKTIRDQERVYHMLDAARKAVEFTSGKDSTQLEADEILTLALVRLLEIIGEAAGCVSVECRSDYPNVPWTAIKGMRNRLIHGYFDCNVELMWKTVKEDLPPLIPILENIIAGKT